jgi:hypothetical protein
MKRLVMLVAVCGLVTPAGAQFSPVQLTVQRVTKKKDAGERVSEAGNMVIIRAGDYSANMALKITVRNSSARPLNGLTLRWAIAKSQVSEYSRGGDAAFGAEQTFDLKPFEQKIIETEQVVASGQQFGSGEARGEKIRGHGVRVTQDNKVLAEEFVPVTVKKCFENLRPVGSGAEEPSSPAEAPGKKPGRKQEDKQ